MHRAVTTDLVPRILAPVIAALLVAFTLALASVGGAHAASTEYTAVQCPAYCLAVYQPVTCQMSNGTVRTFSNRCYANQYACRYRLTIISCRSTLS